MSKHSNVCALLMLLYVVTLTSGVQGLTCSKEDIDESTDWLRTECKGLTHLDPKQCACVDQKCQTYGKTFQNSTDKALGMRSTTTFHFVKNVDRFASCRQNCIDLKKFTCTSFYLLPYSNEAYKCIMVKTTKPKKYDDDNDRPTFVRDCAYE